ncbi:MAG: D-alanyl-D-alanine carboxypeptidase family protein [Gemmatimonadota bacterium]|nr:MAG: D-alanyl-D-alanine carboxypeptidase family protein [Gemmatimonadota bacterium]
MFRDLDPAFRPWAQWLYDTAEYYRLRPRVTSTRRSISHQRELYQRYLRGQSKYPVAKPGCSQHNYGVAIDLVSDNNERLGTIWQSAGGLWGGTRDPVHFGIRWSPCS